MSRKGSFAILAGPDGSGKTTISRALVRRVEDAGLTVTTAHYRPGLIGGRVQGSKITTTPHQQRRRGMLAGVLKLGLLTADMTLGHFFLWRPLRRRGFLIVERGWWDMAVDPARYRLDPRLTGLIKMLGHLIPKADTVVLLAGDATAIDSRKTEIGAEEVARQVTRWQQLAPLAGTGTLTIDSVRSSPDMAAEAIFGTMLSSMAENQLRLRRVPLTPRRLNLQCAGRARPAARLYAPFHPIRRVLYPFTFGIARHALVPPTAPPFDIEALCRHLDLDCEGFVLMHSSHAARWIVGVCERGALSTVIKIGELGDAPLANEELTLRALHHASARMVAVPHLRWSGHWQDHLVVATDALPSTRRRITMADAVKLCNSMVSGGGGMPPVVHGDFAPWNVSVQRSQPVVLDWECARFGRAPMFDLAHFVIMSAALLGRGSPEKAVWQLCGERSAGARHLEAVGEDPSSARQFVRQYLASTPASGHQVAVFRARVEELLCKKVDG